MVVSRLAPAPPPAHGAFAPYELVRELGVRPAGVYLIRLRQPAAHSSPAAKPQLMVAEYFAGLAKGPDGRETEFVREARRIATVASANLTRVRDIVLRDPDVVVYSELLDGEKLAELWRSGTLPLEIGLRVIIDVLSGVGALHNLRDTKQQPMNLAHGEVSPATVAFGLDGVARVLHAIARRAPGARPDPASVAYMAPEVHDGGPYDQRADVFGVGALLWEVLSGAPLFTEEDPAAIGAKVRGGFVPPAKVPDKAPWAKGLVDVAARALAASPDDRWPTAAAMAAEVRKAAGLNIAPVSTAIAYAKSTMAGRSKARRQQLEVMPVLAAAPAAQAERAPAPVHVDTWPAPAMATERDIPVAPAAAAPGADVVDLDWEAMADAVESVPPSAPSGGFVLDAAVVSARLARPAARPPELPPSPVPAPVIREPVAEAEPPSIRGAPVFAAAVVSASAPAQASASSPKQAWSSPPSREPLETAPSLVRLASAHRLRSVLLGVGALAALIVLLAITRLALHDNTARQNSAPTASAAQAAPQVAPSASPPAPTAAEPDSPPAVVSSAVSPPPTPVAPAPAAPAPAVPGPAAAAKPRPPAAARPPAPRPAPSPKKPKSTYHPDSL